MGHTQGWQVVFACAGLIASAVAFGADVVDQCGECHGQSGASARDDVPNIGGMSAFYLEYALETYQQDGRSCPPVSRSAEDGDGPRVDMCELAKGLTPQQIAGMADHFAAQSFVPVPQSTDPALVARGAQLHADHCEKCHTEFGSVADDDAGILAGQRMEYLEFVLQDFHSGKRPTLKKMQEKIDLLSEEDLKALVHAYAAQGGE